MWMEISCPGNRVVGCHRPKTQESCKNKYCLPKPPDVVETGNKVATPLKKVIIGLTILATLSQGRLAPGLVHQGCNIPMLQKKQQMDGSQCWDDICLFSL